MKRTDVALHLSVIIRFLQNSNNAHTAFSAVLSLLDASTSKKQPSRGSVEEHPTYFSTDADACYKELYLLLKDVPDNGIDVLHPMLRSASTYFSVLKEASEKEVSSFVGAMLSSLTDLRNMRARIQATKPPRSFEPLRIWDDFGKYISLHGTEAPALSPSLQQLDQKIADDIGALEKHLTEWLHADIPDEGEQDLDVLLNRDLMWIADNLMRPVPFQAGLRSLQKKIDRALSSKITKAPDKNTFVCRWASLAAQQKNPEDAKKAMEYGLKVYNAARCAETPSFPCA